MNRSTEVATADASAAAHPSARQAAAAGARAGSMAALLMLAVQLAWRLWASPAGVVSLPDSVVGAVSRLTPLGLFGFATETFGSLAQNALFVTVLVAIVAVGYEAGGLAGRLAMRLGFGLPARVAAGLLIAVGLLLFTLLVVLPIAKLGVFAIDSTYTGTILVQMVTTFGLFGLAWAALVGPAVQLVGARSPARVGAAGRPVTRRQAVGQAVWTGGSLVLAAAVGMSAWRLIRTPSGVDRVTSQEVARGIVATAEARSVSVQPIAPTSAPPPALNRAPAIGTEEVEPQPTAVESAVPTEAPDPLDAPVASSPAAANIGEEFVRLEEDGLTPRLTSVADFYHVSKNISDPVVDGEGWTLSISGLVDRPFEIPYEDLVTRATTRKITTLGCISNELNGDLIGTAEWTGLPLRDVLTEAGVQAGVIDLKFRCTDDYEDSISLERAMDPDTLIVVGMNGKPLTPDHGYPARLIVPGIFGMKNVKWVTTIEAVDEDFKGYWQTRGWSDPAPYQIWARIDMPESGKELPVGPAVAAGVAAAGDRGVARVEVSLDDGGTWADATLEPALNPPFTWVRWLLPFEAMSGRHDLVVRVTDGAGTVAPEQRNPPLPDGATGWPSRTVRVED